MYLAFVLDPCDPLVYSYISLCRSPVATWLPENHHLELDTLSNNLEKFHLELVALDSPFVGFQRTKA
jgi:hypothetical protein